jgi:hypothetical protein
MARFIFFLCLCSFYQVPDSDWSLRKNKSGIEVYTRSVEGSSFMEFRGRTIIKNVSLTEVLDVIMDIKNYGSLIPDCMNPRILEQDGKYHVIQYTQTNAPFPVKNRDSIFEQIAEIDEDGKHARVILKPLPDYIAETKDMVRIRKGTGFWDLEADEKGNVGVTYQFHGDPGGDIPSWLANSFVVNQPFKTLGNLKSRVEK